MADTNVKEMPSSEGVKVVSNGETLIIPSASQGKREGVFVGYQEGNRGLYAFFAIASDKGVGHKGIPLEEATRECKTKDGEQVAFPLKIERSNGKLDDGWELTAMLGSEAGPGARLKVTRYEAQQDGSINKLSKIVTMGDLVRWNVVPGER